MAMSAPTAVHIAATVCGGTPIATEAMDSTSSHRDSGSPERRAYVEQAAAMGIEFATLVHPSAVVAPTARLGQGCIVAPGTVIAAHTRIGDHVILNRGVLVGHHTSVGSCVTLSPGANVAGCVEIGDGVFLGMGATVIDRRRVGAGALVAAGAVVVRDVPEGARVQGVPARAVER